MPAGFKACCGMPSSEKHRAGCPKIPHLRPTAKKATSGQCILIAAALVHPSTSDKPRRLFINWMYNSLSLATACEIVGLIHKLTYADQEDENHRVAFERAKTLLRESGYDVEELNREFNPSRRPPGFPVL